LESKEAVPGAVFPICRRQRARTLIDYIAGVARSFRFENDSGFLIRVRSVLYPARRHTVLAGTETVHAVAKLQFHFATPHEVHFVFVVVVAPWELALELHEL
jgi:hypothetical protein